MSNISNTDRLVLLALQAHASGATAAQLQIITHLRSSALQKSLARLASMNRAISFDDQAGLFFKSVPVSDQPLIPLWENWLAFYCETGPTSVEGDTRGTLYLSCGVILLTAITGGTRNPEIISRVTNLPPEFVSLVLAMAKTQNIWCLDSILHLQELLCGREIDLDEIEESLRRILEEFWACCWAPDIEALLHERRGGYQWGGQIDSWINPDVTSSTPVSTIQ